MGKNHRHKKQLKAERGKTKLKSVKTKFLPKGQNVTDTNFKIKPITVREQLVEHGGTVTSKHLNFKDILNRLKHHNVIVKIDSLKQLREYIITIDEDQLDGIVSDVFQAICPLYTDVERSVRVEALKATDDLIGLISENGTEPHIDRIVSYLCCCMTHISEGVREDSLLIFDIFLTQIPRLLASRCDKIIKNFILLISTLKINANDRSMLQSNINQKRTSVQWRLMVLTRLKKFLKAILDRKSEKATSKPIEVIEVTSRVTRTSIYRNSHANAIDIFAQDINIDAWLDLCISDVLPLLRDIWIETQPRNKYTTKSADLYCTVLNGDNSNVLNCIVNILSYFYELMIIKCEEEHENDIENKSFIDNSKEIVSLLYESFPYSREDQNSADLKCSEENLLICYLFFVFFKRVYKKEMVVQTLSYLNIYLLNRNYVPKDKTNSLLKVLKQFYEKNLISWGKYRTTDLTQFIKNTAKYYVNNARQVNSIEIFILLCDQSDLINELFVLVAQKACRALIAAKVQQKTFKTIRLLVLKQNKEVLDALSTLLPHVLDNIKMIELEGVEIERLKTETILSLYQNVPLNQTNIKHLELFANKGQQHKDIVQNIFKSQGYFKSNLIVLN